MAQEITRSRMAYRSIVGAFVVALILLTGVGSAVAFPTPETTVTMTYVGLGPTPEIEQININGSSKSVYVGPYKIGISSEVSAFTYMMCFNAGATAGTSLALATDTTGASKILGWSEWKINMISYLASQWEAVDPSNTSSWPTTKKNANINKAMWEVMAENDAGSLTVKAGKFFLTNDYNSLTGKGINNTQDILDVDALLKDALAYSGTPTPANFLIPGWWADASHTTWVYDTRIQPMVTPVPEPGTLLLLGSGLVGLGLHGWRKRSKAQK